MPATGPNRGAIGFGLQLTGLTLCPVALAFGFADNGPAEWGLLTLAALVFFVGWTLRGGTQAPE